MGRPCPPRPEPEATASAHFIALDIALSRGDYSAAVKAQQTLALLGWDVRRTRPPALLGRVAIDGGREVPAP
jgi:hypothetical protein